MKVSQGIDLIRIERIKKIYSKFQNKFLERICSSREIEQIKKNKKNISIRIAGKYASKEAAAKAVGLGFSNGIQFKDFEILNNKIGKPEIRLRGEAKKQINQIISSSVSISHDGDYVISIVTFFSYE